MEKYTIEIKYGSEFQRELYQSMLSDVMIALSKNMNKTHKDNVFNFYPDY